MTDLAASRNLERNLPDVSVDEAREAARHYFGIDGELRTLHSELDRVYELTDTAGQRQILRIANVDADAAVIDMQVSALAHIAAQDPSLPVPAVIADRDGNSVRRIRFASGTEHMVHVLGYLEGCTLNSAATAGHDSFFALGTMLGQLDLALRGFFHAAADQAHAWNLEKCGRFAGQTEYLQSTEARRIIDAVFQRYSTTVVPQLKSLRHQVIHQDAHCGNVLVDPQDPTRITGLIDFGDMLHGTLVAEIAMSIDADAEKDHLLDRLCATAAGYDAAYPLEEAEIDLLFDVVVARLALTAVIGSSRAALSPDEPVHIEAPERYVDSVDQLLQIGHREGTRRLRAACRFPEYCPLSASDAMAEAEELRLIDARHKWLGRKTTHFYDKPLHFEKASGAYLFGTDGKRYLDCYNNVPQVGHCNPHVVRAIARQARTLNSNTRYLYSSVIEYAERLTAKLAPHLDACVFVNSGSEANDVAWQMAKHVTGNSGAILMEDAYHGVTESIRVFSPAHPDTVMPPYLEGLVVPDPYRGPFRDGEPDLASKYAADADRAIRELANRDHALAAFMIDSAFCSSGVPNVPPGYLQAVEQFVKAAGGLMICDEVQSGFGRMGQWWGHEHHGVRADIVTLGKPAANGHPFGVVVTTSDILNAFIDKTRFFSTFGGNT
ncbi:MAG: aminotransferase class III-fold pyridoxal phosphate-dependent enzyme, partial [Gammaproteobacteria bacterium]|nr:aminotransferase class III-fold pyridoxal phosphate-dependent enzyme [Gammaproteobacteria bacterium]